MKDVNHHCPLCTGTFHLKSELTNHIKQDHSDNVVVVMPELKCPKCERIFTKVSDKLSCFGYRQVFLFQKSNLDRHSKSGKCDKEWPKHKCPTCSDEFHLKCELTNHIKQDHPVNIVAAMPELTCPKCGSIFTKVGDKFSCFG